MNQGVVSSLWYLWASGFDISFKFSLNRNIRFLTVMRSMWELQDSRLDISK